MLEESNTQRRARLDEELKMACYRRFKLEKEIEDIDRAILQLEGAINENESTKRDLATEAAISNAKDSGLKENKEEE